MPTPAPYEHPPSLAFLLSLKKGIAPVRMEYVLYSAPQGFVHALNFRVICILLQKYLRFRAMINDKSYQATSDIQIRVYG
jgi:hypothetical protein